MRRCAVGALAVALLTSTAGIALAEESQFNRIASWPVAENLPEDADPLTRTSAEIIAASDDGRMLVYSDSPLGGIGMVDITDPANPEAAGTVMLDGEPTAVAVVNGVAVVGINTSASFTEPSGRLDAVALDSGTVVAGCDLGGQPDSVAVAPDGSFAAVAIENERDEDLNDGELPQLPAGALALVELTNTGAPDCGTLRTVDLTGLAEVAPSDPEPEFVDVNAAGHVLVTLQENNHVVVVDGATGEIASHFSAGTVDLANVDTEEEGAIRFEGSLEDVPREPDAAKWLGEDRFVMANEGDYEGGSRGFTIMSADGEVLYESGLAFEYALARIGHYPEERSGNKGVEPEGMEVATFDGEAYLFVMSERGSVVGVYRDTGGVPELVQLLPSGIGPESAVAIPERGLLATANEEDLGEDGGPRAHVMIFERQQAPARYPTIISTTTDEGLPIGWGALSGLAADPEVPGKLYAVTDSFYGSNPQILTIETAVEPALITDAVTVSRDGEPVPYLDLEGIVALADGTFWLASEGRTDRDRPHAILHVDATGAVVEEVAIPEELAEVEIRYGFEGITAVGEGEDLQLWMATQREWRDDPEGRVKLVAYAPATGEWGAVHYPLDDVEQGWIGLSEITAVGDTVYIVERDNQLGGDAQVKKLYAVPTAEMKAAPLGGELPVVSKTEVLDFIPELAAFESYITDKVEGFAVDVRGNAYAVTDNDGVDESSGETFFLRLGRL
jgi:hypothetical protein